MILTVTLNPAIDKSSSTEILKPESKLRCKEVVREPGGGGINVSKALNELETPNVALFPSGGNNGRMLCALLEEEGIHYHAIDTSVETREAWIMLETSTNHQFRFNFPGRPIKEECVYNLIDAMRSFAPSYVVASGSLPPGLPDHFYGLIVKNANALGAKTIIDTSGAALQGLKGKGTWLIKPNINELKGLLNVTDIPEKEVDDAARQVIRDGYAEIVVVSMGAKGAWLVSAQEKYFASAPQVEKKSTVGAGDSLVAGLTHAFLKQYSYENAIRFGVACGSAATKNSGTQLFKKEDVYSLYEQVNINA